VLWAELAQLLLDAATLQDSTQLGHGSHKQKGPSSGTQRLSSTLLSCMGFANWWLVSGVLCG
jgi:hypothetical protein